MSKGKAAEDKDFEGDEVKTPRTRSAKKRNVSTAMPDDDDYGSPAGAGFVTPSKSRSRRGQAAGRTSLRRGRSSQLVADVDGTSSPLASSPQSNDPLVSSPLSTKSYLYSSPPQVMTPEHSSGSDTHHANGINGVYDVKPERVSPPQSRVGNHVAAAAPNGGYSSGNMQQTTGPTANGLNWSYAQQYRPVMPSSMVNMGTSTMPSMQSYYQAPQAQISNDWSSMYRQWLSGPQTAFRVPGQQMMVPQDIVATPVSLPLPHKM